MDGSNDSGLEHMKPGIEQLQKLREEQLKKIKEIEKMVPVKKEQIMAVQSQLKSTTARIQSVAEEAGSNPNLPPFLLSCLGVLVVSILLWKMNKKFLMGFFTRLMGRFLVLCFLLAGIAFSGKLFLGETFDRWIMTLIGKA